MEELSTRLALAKHSNAELEALLKDYMPFIKKEIGRHLALGVEYDDRLSLGMLIFMQCVHQYNQARGNFFAYTATAIRNRLIDEGRKHASVTGNTVPLGNGLGEGTPDSAPEVRAAVDAYSRQSEQAALAEEISLLDERLKDFGIEFDELDRICPKYKRARQKCIALAHCLLNDNELCRSLFVQKRLPISRLAARSGASTKVLETHRRYIITLCLILSGDYPLIRSFVPDTQGETW